MEWTILTLDADAGVSPQTNSRSKFNIASNKKGHSPFPADRRSGLSVAKTGDDVAKTCEWRPDGHHCDVLVLAGDFNARVETLGSLEPDFREGHFRQLQALLEMGKRRCFESLTCNELGLDLKLFVCSGDLFKVPNVDSWKVDCKD